MILLVNVFITNKGLNKYDRGGLPSFNRLDIFKYTLASYAVIPWERCIFNIKLDEEFKPRQQEILNWIYKLFGPDLTLNWNRLETRGQWLDFINYDLHPLDLIWLACNDDHVFIDYDLTCLQDCLSAIIREEWGKQAIYYSHWVEPYRHAKQLHLDGKADFEILDSGVLKTKWDRKDSIQIISHPLLWDWFHSIKGNDNEYCPRPDWKPENWIMEPYRCFIPYRELCRHFDGASHLFHPNDVPPLTIPEGFFEEDIIRLPTDYTYYKPMFWPDADDMNKSTGAYKQVRRLYALAHTNHPDFQILPDEEWLSKGDPK